MKETTKAWARKRGDKRIRQLEWILQAQAANQPTIAILRQTETETIEISRFLLIYVFMYIYRRACCVLQPPFCYAQLPILMLLPPAIYPCLFDAFPSSSHSSTLFIDKLWIYEGRLNSSRFFKIYISIECPFAIKVWVNIRTFSPASSPFRQLNSFCVTHFCQTYSVWSII